MISPVFTTTHEAATYRKRDKIIMDKLLLFLVFLVPLYALDFTESDIDIKIFNEYFRDDSKVVDISLRVSEDITKVILVLYSTKGIVVAVIDPSVRLRNTLCGHRTQYFKRISDDYRTSSSFWRLRHGKSDSSCWIFSNHKAFTSCSCDQNRRREEEKVNILNRTLR